MQREMPAFEVIPNCPPIFPKKASGADFGSNVRNWLLNAMRNVGVGSLAHDLEKWRPVFPPRPTQKVRLRGDHAQTIS
jgi:hypothetical protein